MSGNRKTEKPIEPITSVELIIAAIWSLISIVFTLLSIFFSSSYGSFSVLITRNTIVAYLIPWIFLIIYRCFCYRFKNTVINAWYGCAKIAVCSFINISFFVIGAFYGKDSRGHMLIMMCLNYIVVSCASSIACKHFNKYGSPNDIQSFVPGFVSIVICFSTYWQSMSGYRSYMQSTGYSAVAIWAYVSLIAIIVSLIITIKKMPLLKVEEGKVISLHGTGPVAQRAKIKQFQRAYLAKTAFDQKKEKNKRAYNLALLLDYCEAPGAKSLMESILQRGSESASGKKTPMKSVYSPEVKNPFSKGESFILGHYMYEKDKSIKPIEWIIIDVRPDSILLLSRYALDKKSFGENDRENRIWASSNIREWLNKAFYDAAFTDKEKVMITQTQIKTFPSQSTAAARNRPRQLSPSIDYDVTSDRVFLLDTSEVELIPHEYRIALPTPYYESISYDCVTDYSTGDYSSHPKYAKSWALRNLSYSPKYSSWWYPDEVKTNYSKQAVVEEISSITSDVTIRPAIIVSLLPYHT